MFCHPLLTSFAIDLISNPMPLIDAALKFSKEPIKEWPKCLKLVK